MTNRARLPPSVKGMADLLPEDLARHTVLSNVVRRVLSSAGFQELRTPIVEPLELFSRSLGIGSDIVNKEMYTFQDLSGRMLALRPEGTAPLVRAILEHHLYAPGDELRFFYEGPMFRYEQPQKGRLRQFHQIGAEVIGVSSPAVDVELVLIAREILDALMIPEVELHWNNIGCPRCRPRYREALQAALLPYSEKLCEHCQKRLDENPLRILDCKNPGCRALVQDHAPLSEAFLCTECAKHKEEFEKGIEAAGITAIYDPYLVRGLDYYTRTVFEFISPELAGQNALLAGGRYDELFGLFGAAEIPACGLALGVERILLVAQLKTTPLPAPHLVWIPLGEEVDHEALHFLKALRREGWICRAIYHKGSLKAALRYAGKLASRYVVMDGEEERARNSLKVRDMSIHKEYEIPRTLQSLKEFLYVHTRS